MPDIQVSSDIHAFLQAATDAAARTELGVDAAGTDNSTDVTLSGTGTYISIAGQVITVDAITESDISDLGTYLTDLTGEALSTLSDVTITSIASGEVLVWNGSAWINQTLAEAGIGDVTGPGTLADEEIARFSGTTGKVLQGTTNSTLNDQGHLKLQGSAAAVDIKELAASPVSQAGTGHYWTKDDAPTRPKFTDDTGGEKYLDLQGDLEAANNLSDVLSALSARANLGLAIGTDVQAHSAVLDATTASFTTADETKLDGIEALADVTDATNVNAAGATMNTDADVSTNSWVIDEDTMVTDTALKVPTQQSVKAYVDANAGGAPEGTAVLSTGETGGTKFLREDGDGTSSWQPIAGGGDALVANPLSQFAATTSAQLAGVLSDETGTGAAVFATSPTLVTPALGTPSSGVATNLTGTAAGLTAGNVTTNANLTGHVTSVGNAATLGSFTSAQLNTAISDATLSGNNTGDEAAASDIVSGTVELATIAEVDTGTDTVRAITPAGLAGSALQTKVEGIETAADVTDTTNVTAAGALMDSEVTNLAQVKAFSSADYATAAQGTTADAALPTTGGAMTGAITTTSTFDGRDVATDGAKLDGIEALADVTDTANVTTAGALMDSEVTNLAQVKAFNSADYATAAQGTTADAALPKAGGAVTGPITTTSTFDGRDVATDGTKLDGIEALADVTDATNVGAALTLTGDVTSSGSMVTTIATDAVDIPMLSATGTADSTTYLRGDNTWATPAGGSGVAISEDVTQTAHGFVVKNTIYHNGTDWQLATANAEATAEVLGVVETVADVNNFTVNLGGKFTGTGFAAGTTYFLSDATAGLLTATEPTAIGSISKPVLYAISTTVGYVHNYRGIEISGSSTTKGQLGITIDGAGSAITTGIKGDLRIPYNCTISSVEVVLDQSGSIVIDIWNDSYANYPAIDGDSITASAPPTVSTATKSKDSTLTGWALALSAGDYLRFNVDSITTATRATLTLEVTKT